MRKPSLLPAAIAGRDFALPLLLALALAARLPAATVLTGDVTPALPWSLTTSVDIGNTSAGTLAVDDGSVLSSLNATLGDAAGATGTATITGVGSQWINGFPLYVGDFGSGTLRVEAGGQVRSAGGYLGNLPGSAGIATITGPGSTWTNSAELYVGRSGSGALRVEAGGQVISAAGLVGDIAYSTGTATVTGLGSQWAAGAALLVGGRNGNGTLHVEAGGQVSSTTGALGAEIGSTGITTITGPGSTWTNRLTIFVGERGNGTLRVEAGGQVSSTNGVVGNGSTGAATVTGAGSTWTNSAELQIGARGSGALRVEAGGLVSVRGTLTIDSNGGGDSFINMATGGMLALGGDADDSLSEFLGLVAGTDAIRYWNASLADWAPLTAGAPGVDYTLQYQDAGDLAGYTLLTVGTLPAVPEPDTLALVALAAASTLLRRRSPCGRGRSRTMG
jgi:T5SS/PEP-CTERM-associated repeat protein